MPADAPQRRLFPGPAVQLHHGELTGEDAAAWRNADRGDAVGAGDRNGLAVGVVGRARPQVRVVLNRFGRVGKAPRTGLVEAQRGAWIDEARIDVCAGSVNHLRSGRHGDAGPESLDAARLEHDCPALDAG